MRSFKDLFLNEAADTAGTPRRTIKASLKMATDDALPTKLAPPDSNDDNFSESEQKKME